MILELVLVQSLAGQQVVNKWNYVSSGTPVGVTNSQGLIVAFGGVYDAVTTHDFPADTCMKFIRNLQSSDVKNIQLLCRNIYPGADFYEIPYPLEAAGSVDSPSLPPFAAYGFNTSRVTTAIRRGQKRFAGVTESANDGEGNLNSTFLGLMGDLADAMSANLSYTDGGNSLTFIPAIVHKEKYTTPAGNDAYRYYSTEAVQLTHLAQGFAWNTKSQVRSQTSRQYGRGQ